jgi:hypothetical protein
MKSGDIFRFPLNSREWAFGKIWLDIQKGIDSKKINKESPLFAFPKSILVEIYVETSTGKLPDKRKSLIPGIFTGSGCLKDETWEIIGNEKVDAKEIDFPEGLSSEKTTQAAFIKGEVRKLFDMEFEEIEKIGIVPNIQPCRIFHEFVLFHLGRRNEIDNPYLENIELRNLGKYDLRFSSVRKKILDLAGLDENESYNEMSKRFGFDLERLIE